MKKYDLGQPYDETQKYTEYDLITEIIKELGRPYKIINQHNDSEIRKSIRDKFRNKDESGISDKLKKNFCFDIELIAKKSKENTFDKFKLLKFLFFLDKQKRMEIVPTEEKSCTDNEKRDIIFLDMLAKPRLENINTILPVNSYNGDVYKSVCAKIRSFVPNSTEFDYHMMRVNSSWQNYVTRLLDIATRNPFLDLYQNPADDLTLSRNLLFKNIISKINKFPTTRISDEKIISSFFCIVNAHTYLCNRHDNLTINDEFSVPESPAEECIARFKHLEEITVSWDILDLSKKITKCHPGEGVAKELLRASLYYECVDGKKLTTYKNVLKYVKLVATWYGLYINRDFSSKINMLYLVSIIQEIIYVKENNIEVKNDFLGYNNMYRSLTSALKSPQYTNPIVILAWQKRVENRIIANIGQTALAIEKRHLEECLFDIEKFIYSFRNPDDMKLVNDFLYNKAVSSILSDFQASRFVTNIFKKINNEVARIGFETEFSFNYTDYLSFFKKIILDKEKKINFIIEHILSKINESTNGCYNDELMDVIELTFLNRFESDLYCIEDGMDVEKEKKMKKNTIKHIIQQDFKLYYQIDFTKKTVTFMEVVEKLDASKIKRLTQLGFDNF